MRTASFRTELCAFALIACGCSKAPPEPVARSTTDAGAVPVRDAGQDAGVADAAADTGGGEDLGWDLDPKDPARDYVKRYILATKRYGDKTSCAAVGGSRERDGGPPAVEVRDTPKCGGTNALRDVFRVDVEHDRLTQDGPSARPPLAPWPDGSAPDARAAPVASIASLREWASPMADAFRASKLAPIRIQLYGRGTYPVVTLAAWHAPIERDASGPAVKETGQKLCAASDGRPFAVTAALDARTWLRFECDGTFRWDRR